MSAILCRPRSVNLVKSYQTDAMNRQWWKCNVLQILLECDFTDAFNCFVAHSNDISMDETFSVTTSMINKWSP